MQPAVYTDFFISNKDYIVIARVISHNCVAGVENQNKKKVEVRNMSNAIVVYKSKYGSTEKYAGWIAEDAGADLRKAGEADLKLLLKYDMIIYCGGLYAGGILGFSRLKRLFGRLTGRRILVVAVGATSEGDKARKEIEEKNLTPEMKGKVPLFLLRGGLNYPKMNPLDRFLMFFLVRSARSQDPAAMNNETKGLIATYGKTVDFTNRKTITPVVEWVMDKKTNAM